MRETGLTIKLMELESFGMWTETTLKVIGKMTRLMAMESIYTRTELNMRVSGRTIFKKEMGLKLGLMVLDIMVNI